MNSVVCARHLSMKFGSVEALSGIDFEVGSGEIFGLIGADGAGKTTTFRILSGVLPPSGGEVEVLGKLPRASREKVGYLTQPFSLYLDLSVMENLTYAAGLREVSAANFATRSRRYLDLFELADFTDRLAGRLSGGMKQKLALSCALIADPQILLLDEPTTGVDPVTRRDFWDALSSLATGGMTIIVATPYLDEAERCHRVALMERGRIYQIDAPAAFRAKLGLSRLEVHASDLARSEKLLKDLPGLADIQRFGDRLDVMVTHPEVTAPIMTQTLEKAGLVVTQMKSSQPTLENAFVAQLREMRGAHDTAEFPGRSASLAVDGGVAVEAISIQKTFGDFRAVHDFDLEIKAGEVYGLLGANGAGKTTAIKIICGLLTPTAGTIRLMGQKEGLRTAALRTRLGYMSQKFTLYDDLTIGENLDFYARLYGLDESVRAARRAWVLESSDLVGEENMLTGQLPGGWKQRVAFGAAVMHEPSVVFLDEPTSGVDPLARRAMWRQINEMADKGVAILVVTHYLEEAEQCNRLGFMVAGEIIAEGSPSQVKKLIPGHLLELSTTNPQAALLVLREKVGPTRVSLFGDRLHLIQTDGPLDPGALLAGAGIQVLSSAPIDFSLEDVFISLIETRRHAIPQ